MLIKDLKCNHQVNPLGVDTVVPRLSWILYSEKNGAKQIAYRIVASTKRSDLEAGEYDLWDSGVVVSERSIEISYEGRLLVSREACWWMVQIQDVNGKWTGWSSSAYFEMGLLSPNDWEARWICDGTTVNYISTGIVPAPLLRKPICIKEPIKKARAYICGLGYYDFSINGIKIGSDVLAPAFTRYDRTILYNTYDITGALVLGENVLGVILGNGCYNSFTSEIYNLNQAEWRHHQKLLLQVHVTYMDGEEQVFTSDVSWKAAKGPITFDGLRNGEFYDARLEKQGWNTPTYDDSDCDSVKIAKAPAGVLKSSQLPPIQVTQSIISSTLIEAKPGVWVFDLGQNISGWAKLRVCANAGTEIKLRFAEKLHENGELDDTNINMFIFSGECQTDRYIAKGEGVEEWEPRFTYHGFQYVEITGYPGTPTLDSICGQVVHTALKKRGSFTCSNELLNQIQQCVIWSTLTNYHGFPTDCPHREKGGWTGDASLSAEQVLMNFDSLTAYTKWMGDFQDVQRLNGQIPGIVPTGGWGYNWGSGPAWDSAMILIPWYMYVYDGEWAILEMMYGNMKSYVDFMTSMAENHIVDFGLGDWCEPNSDGKQYKCPVAVTDTAYYYVDAIMISKIAAVLAQFSNLIELDILVQDEKKYTKLASDIRYAFREKFIDTKTGNVTGNCQTSLACVLYQGLVDEEENEQVLQRLVEQVELQNRHIDCGILGSKYLLHILTELGRTDLAYAIATQSTFPGWGYWIAQGANTLWENWDGSGSRNHHMFSDISAWFYKGLAGIQPDQEEPGFKHILFKPNPVEGLDWVKASHNSPYGIITCDWEVEQGKFHIHLTIPVNCRATLFLPKQYSAEVIELQSGIHNFTV